MIALIVLSQLKSLVGTIDAASVLVPIVSAMCYLLIGGAVALFVVPPFLEKYILDKIKPEYHATLEMGIMFAILLGLMPATYYSQASYLMGAFVTGLAFCTSEDLQATFLSQFKRILFWLMKIFFSSKIGFQVPIKDFGNAKVIWQGLVFTLALTGKVAVGILVPNFTQSSRFEGHHLRDCLIASFSMACEGEFAYVISVFGVESGLISRDVYASIVLAVLCSAIVPPFILRFILNYYRKCAEEEIRELALSESNQEHDFEDKAMVSTTK